MKPVKSFLVLCLLLLSPLSLAQNLPEEPPLAQEGWQSLNFDNKTPNRFSKENGGIAVRSNNSVSVLYKDIDVDLGKTPTLSWSWKVTKNVRATDLTTKGQDDRSLALYVNFPFDESRAGFWERLSRPLVVALKGENTPGRVLSYVWGDDEEIGTILESPYLKSAGAIIILQKAETYGEQWLMESVNVAEDYQKIFGDVPLKPFQIALSADTDDTKGQSLGYVRDIRFE